MIARIIPVGLDPRFADQRFGDFPVRSLRKRTVERLKHEAMAATMRFQRKQGLWGVVLAPPTVETHECP